jgi:hypothetical protein
VKYSKQSLVTQGRATGVVSQFALQGLIITARPIASAGCFSPRGL